MSLSGQEMNSNVIFFDNQSCIKLFENPVFHDKSKNIDIWYHFICNYVLKRGCEVGVCTN